MFFRTHWAVALKEPEALPFVLSLWAFFFFFFLSKTAGGSHLLEGDCPLVEDLSPHSPLEASPSRLSVSQLDWQVQSNHCVLIGPKLTPATQLSQDNAGLPHPPDLPLCVLIELQDKLVLCTLKVIENMWLKKGRDLHQWTWLHPTGATVRACERWYRHVASSLWGLKHLFVEVLRVEPGSLIRLKGIVLTSKWSHVPAVCCRQSRTF